MLNEFLFAKIEEEGIGDTAEATRDVLRPFFKDSIITRRAGVVWPPRRWDLTPLDYYLWGTVKDKGYPDQPETIEAAHNR